MSTDFVEKVRETCNTFSPPVRSLMDVDFYKFLMGQAILAHHPDVEVTFELLVRDKTISIADIVPERELRDCLDHAMDLRFLPTDLYYLRGMDLYDRYLFKEEYLDFLRSFTLPPYSLAKQNGSYALTFRGPWARASMWETIALAVISELYYRALMRAMPPRELDILYARAKDRIYRKFERLQQYSGLRFADFGQRRRHSFLWQEWVIGLCKAMLPDQFTGTSNTWMAFHHNLPPIGTNAHELPMVYAALAETDNDKMTAQYRVLEDWQKLYGQGLRIMLPDTYTSGQFYRNAPEWVWQWRGMRQDSGDPDMQGSRYVGELLRRGIDPKEKLIIFSDGLDVDTIIGLYERFADTVGVAFGWGTLLTNDFRGCCPANLPFRPFSMVCKVVEANGRPCVKLSDNMHKATGPAEEITRYIRIFGNDTARTADTPIV